MGRLGHGDPIAPGPGCTINADGSVSSCTDRYALALTPAEVPQGGCSQLVSQEVYVGDRRAETHNIIFTLDRTGSGCSGHVERQ